MTSQEALSYIHALPKSASHPDLEHTRALLALLGNPQNAYRCIHVAGTNGKGSFCAISDSVLRAAGYRVGLFTSPFIRTFEERIRVNGVPISADELAEITEAVKIKAEQLPLPPSEFEFITAVGFEYFRRRRVDLAVLEVGLGGRLDPTNVIKDPLLSVITGIDFDHTEFLGNTIQSIAAEKGGIIKNGFPSLYGGADSSACRTLSSVASSRRSAFHTVDYSRLRVQSYSLRETVLDFGELKELRLPLLGSYQPRNVATALTAMEILAERDGLRISEKAIRQGLSDVRWSARFELLRAADPIIIFDGSHNPQGVAFAVKSIREYFPEQKVNILSGVMADKDYDGMIEAMKPVTECAFTTAVKNPRTLSAEAYAAHFLEHHISARSFESAEECVRTAIEESRAKKLPLICLGSLYLYRELADLIAAQP